MAAEFTSDNIRNIVLAGHGGSGKTTLAEAMLYAAKETSRMGSVEEGNTVSDYHTDEIERGISITLSAMHCTWKGRKINILDTPGFPDFIGETKSAVRVADAMVMTVDASAGVGFGADSAWEFAEEVKIPVLFVLTKVGVEQAHFEETLQYLREHFSRDVVPLEYPVYQNKTLVAMVNILSMKVMTFAEDGSGSHADSADIPAEVQARCLELRTTLVETLAESDETLMDTYFNNGTLTDAEVEIGLRTAFRRRKIYPLFAAQSTKNVGITPLMDFIIDYAPSPLDAPMPVGAGPHDEPITLGPNDADPALFVFKTVSEHHVGELSFFRVFAGHVSGGMELVNNANSKGERLNQLFTTNGKNRQDVSTLHFGDIGAVVKLKSTHTNNTLTSKARQLTIPTIWYPAPIADAAVYLKGKGDEAKVSEGLHMMHEEDPTFNVYHDSDTHETVVSGLGEMHLEVIIKRLQSKYGVEVEMKPPRIPYRETIKGSTTTSYRHKKQTGGAGQFGEVHFHIEPWEEGRPVPHPYQVRSEDLESLPYGGKFHFVNSIVGGTIDARFIPAVKKGILETLQRGAFAGYPMTNVRVILFDGKMHPVDSNENAFKTAARMCFKQGVKECRPQLMEPIWNIEVVAPVDAMGDIMSDLSSRRGRILGMDSKGTSQMIKAQIPLAELYGYAARLRGLTQGRGSYTRSFSHYEEVPKEIEAKIVASAELEEVEE
ncbi:MAG TPA: elongation factor G [Candidatus Kapabacteria bacterium]|nr:elongation factor G [Candidatus Kapabacteria bacterium]